MKQIRKENMKIGDFIYLVDKGQQRARAFMIKITNLDINIDWWRLSEKPKDLFELDTHKEKDNSGDNKGNTYMTNSDWESYNLSKLNKKEISQFKRHIILQNLK